MTSILEKGGGTFAGIKLLLCENSLPPIEEAIAAAQAEVPHSNYYTEPYSEPLRRFIADSIGVPQQRVHINAGSELIPAAVVRAAGSAGAPAHAHLSVVSGNRAALHRDPAAAGKGLRF
jgi:histidinol-phosphate/aromatic aminotransferase/cobyric acid decarboxylase-like protein